MWQQLSGIATIFQRLVNLQKLEEKSVHEKYGSNNIY